MNAWIRGVVLLGLATTVPGCAGLRPPTTGTTTRPADYNGYAEDLSVVRPTYSPPAVSRPPVAEPRPAEARPKPAAPGTSPDGHVVEALHITRRLDLVMDTIAERNWSVRYAAGYRVQVYMGNERREADAAKLLLYQNFPELNPYMTFLQPSYKLKVGDFMRRLDAERYFASLKQLFPSARLMADRIDVRRSLLIK